VPGQRRALRRTARALALAGLALALAPATAMGALGDRVLKLGARGADVRALQGHLDAAGYTLVQTGRYDRRTRGRVQAFQNDNGLRATGVVTRRVARMIKATATASPGYGGTLFDPNPPKPSGPVPAELKIVAGTRAKVLRDGTAAAPAAAPDEVKRVIASGNEIARLPYKWGGGHARWRDTGYDCTGSVTYAFRTTFRRGPYPTFGYSNWELPGPGRWITVYANSGHVYAVIAGLRFDSSGLRVAGSRWTDQQRSAASFVARHPAGF
jgi:peptidoglycan hydrolase-like protein with peptidoglycan-binding domain